jgi:integrase
MWFKVMHVKRVKAKGRVYYYHRKTGERLEGDRDGALARALEINATLAGPPRRSGEAAKAGTLAELIARYKASPEYQGLAANTKRHYAPVMDFVGAAWGHVMVKRLKRRDVRGARDEMLKRDESGAITGGTRKADKFVSALSAMIAWGIDLDDELYGAVNPASGIEPIHQVGGYPPWPADVLARFLAAAHPALRGPILAILCTAQRGQDVVALTWSQYDGRRLALVQKKTGKDISVPVHPELKRLLDGLREEQRRSGGAGIGATIVPLKPGLLIDEVERRRQGWDLIFRTRTGKPWTVAWLERETAALLATLGTRGYTPHGLAKNAIVRLFEAGCSEREIQEFTGKSPEMTRHYGRQADQKRLADRALKRLVGTERARKMANRRTEVENP